MATVGEKPTKPLDGEHRVVLRGVGWEGYQSILRMVDDQPVRMTYDRGDVELMSPSPKHERKKSLLGQFVRILAREFRIAMMPMGSTTWSREDLDKGLEADESFYLGDLERLKDPDNIDLDADPPPDLAIEIEITSHCTRPNRDLRRTQGSRSLAIRRAETPGTAPTSRRVIP